MCTHVAAAETPPYKETVKAWTTARSWLDRDHLPDLDTDTSATSIEGVTGASVVLRLNGRTVGRASEFADDDQLLRRVTGRALAQALGDRTLRNLPTALRDEASSRLTLEVEFAGELEPLLGNDLSAAVARVRPGIDGLAVRRGNDWAHTFPGRAVATGTADSATSSILKLVADLGLPPKDLPALRQIDRVGIYRFDTRRFAQTGPDELPFQAERCGEYVDLEQVRGSALAEFGETVLRHLLAHCSNKEDQAAGAPPLLGNFDPVADRYTPVEAPPLDRALVAWALASASHTAAIDAELRAMASRQAHALLETLTELPEDAAPITIDLVVLAAAELADTGEERDDVAVRILQKLGPPILQEGAGVGTASDRIRRAAAIVAMPEAVVPAADNDTARRNLDLAWSDAKGEVILPNIDWFVLAEREMAERTGRIALRTAALMDARTALLERQLDHRGDLDLEGGIALQRAARHRVDARVLRTAIGLAILEDLEPGEVADLNREGLEGLLRFTRQLQLAPDDATLFRGGHRGVGGIRESPWSPNQPLAAEASALRLICECLD
ncbi:MAG: hypothetical protein MK085_04755 [Phycisphaerales bacterium]|nr:hypothetical protein [Phycisphaerales bacterium]